MANEEQLSILKQGVEVWNRWRGGHIVITVDFREANLMSADLRGADLRKVDFTGANLSAANLRKANLSRSVLINTNLSKANLRGAKLGRANLSNANLSGADLTAALLQEANLSEADLREATLAVADLHRANLRVANLSHANLKQAHLAAAVLCQATLVSANLHRADLTVADLSQADLRDAFLRQALLVGTKVHDAKASGSVIYAINVWDLEGEFEEQKDLIITRKDQPKITVDNLKVAQFIYLILNNEEIRDVINALTSKSVLILGRFALPERKMILDTLRNKLREYNLLPIVFDFDRPTDKDFTETIKTLAGLCYFVIADITNPKSSPLELQATVPDYQIPFVPIIQEGESPFAMMVDLQKKYNWVLPTRSYDSIDTLMKALKPGIIDPAIKLHYELRLSKAKEQNIHPLQDFIDK